MNENAPEFWQRVKDLIKSQNTTQEWLAQQCGVVIGTFKGQIFRQVFPDAQQSVKIAQALNTSVEYLVTGISSNPAETELAQLKQKLLELGHTHV